jgi:ATP-dependent DNA helicase HFM1/MER3
MPLRHINAVRPNHFDFDCDFCCWMNNQASHFFHLSAMGVNLPAHLVVIKGTTLWRGAGVGYTAIDSGTLLQMMGRAGRPGFDSSGTAVIMTDVNNKAYYDSFGGPNAKPIESQLLGKLVEKINIEISQRVIRNSHQCVRWLKSTFFFARALKDPKKYGMKGASDNDMEGLLLETCRKALADLESSEIIRILEDRSTVLPSVASNVMSHHLVDFESMKRFMSLAHDSGPFHLLEALSQCGELQYPVRRSEKSILNEAHKIVRYKLDVELSKFRVQTPSQKAFILLQVSIGQHYLEDFTLRQEMTQIVDIAQRLLKAIEDFSIQSSRHGAVALESFLMRRSLATSLWGSSDGVLNQVSSLV